MKNEIVQRQEKARKLMSEKGFGALVLATAENVQYLTGVTEPSIHACGVVVMVPQQAQPVLGVLWLDEEAALQQAKEVSVQTYTPDTQGTVITKILEQGRVTKGMIGMDDRALTWLENSLKKSLPGADLVNASNAIEELRWVKFEEEIRFIQKACEISEQGMKVALESLKPRATELQIASLAEHQMMTLGSDRMKHRTIVASGPRAGLVHPFASQKKIKKGDLVAIDLGAVYHGYCSDIARTSVVGRPSEELKSDFDVLRRVQDSVLRKLRSGVSIKEIEAVAQEVAKAAGCQLIGHVGHSIGLKLEEKPTLRSIGYGDVKIESNIVMAFFQSMIQSKRSLGVRLEDTVVVTESGAKMLTTYPRELFS